MKNIFKALCGAALLISFTAKAQTGKKLYTSLNFGYSLPLIGQPIGMNSVGNSNPDGTYTYKSKTNYSRLGSGINGGLVIGYAFSKFVAVEIGSNYIHTSTFQENDIKDFANNVYTTISESNLRSSIVNIMPGLRFFNQFGENEIFFRMAPVIGIASLYQDMMYRDLATTSRVTEISTTLNGGLSFGMFLSGGYTKFVAKNLGISLELFSNLQNYVPRKGEITRYVVNGTDELSGLKKSQREFMISNEATYSSDNTPNDNWPRKIAKDANLSYLLSGVGLQIGLHYKF